MSYKFLAPAFALFAATWSFSIHLHGIRWS